MLALLKSGFMQIFLASFISLRCTDETETCPTFSFAWDTTSSLLLLIPVPYAGMARVLRQFSSSLLSFLYFQT